MRKKFGMHDVGKWKNESRQQCAYYYMIEFHFEFLKLFEMTFVCMYIVQCTSVYSLYTFTFTLLYDCYASPRKQ